MSVDVAPENEIKTQNGSSEVVQVNGVSNGHHSSSSSSSKHKSSSKDKHRDKDRDHKSSSSSSKDHKSSSRDKDKHHSSSSSSSKDKHRDKDKDGSKHSSSSSSSHRDKDRDKDKDKDKHKSSSSSSSSHHKSSSKDKDRKDKDRDRKESSSSSSKDKDKDKERDRDRHHKSSSSSSSRDKDKDKDRHRSSSSSKHKHSSSSTSKSSSSRGDKAKLTDGEFIKPEPISQPPPNDIPSNGYNKDFIALKPEPVGNELMDDSNTGFENGSQPKDGYEEKPNFKAEESNINISQASSCDYSMSQFKEDEPDFVVKEEAEGSGEEEPEQNTAECEEDDDEDIPLAKRKANTHVRDPLQDDEDDEEDVPLAKRKIKAEVVEEDDDEDVPLLARKKVKKEASSGKTKNKKKRIKEEEEEDDYEESKPKKKKTKKVEPTQVKQETASPAKRKKKQDEEEEEVWRWWEEEKREDGVKWNTLEHKGPVFAPPYERVPKNVRFFYDGKPLELSEETEEAATFYAKMLNHDYCTRSVFNDNFFKDFRKTMTSKEREIIKDFKKCNFEEMFQYFTAESEKRKNSTKEEKLARKLENEAVMKEYGTCLIDGHKEKIGNFKLEPPGLFRGRGEHPKMGMIKRRIQAEDVSINCGKEAKVPPPPPGHRWKEVRHDNTVTWLASWIENVQGQVKYIMLNPSSKLKGEKDHIKYETARRLAKSIDKIRATYRDEWKSKEMRVRQRAVALYFIDKLALRAGNEKDEDQADTVGCCSLRVEHVKLKKELNGKENVVIFDFLGKDSIRYYNEVEVEKRVFKNLELFLENKKEGDDLFDRLNTQVLNEHLKELMEGLTAKVFRTYNASITLQNQLNLLTEESMSPAEKLLAYNRANRAVAILCNHQRSVPKGHEKSMENLKEKIRQKREAIEDAESEYHDLKKAAKRGSVKERVNADKKAKQLERLKEQLKKLELQETDRDENKTIALGTSKLNYLDPRITVAWCKKHGVPIEKIFNKTQRNKFMWAIHMADENYVF